MKTNRDAGLRGRRNDLGEAISGIAIVDPCVTAWARQHPVIALVAAPLKNRVLRVAEAGCAQVGLWLSAAAIRLFHVHKGVRPERHQLIVLALCVPILKARKLLFQSSIQCAAIASNYARNWECLPTINDASENRGRPAHWCRRARGVAWPGESRLSQW